LNGRPFERHGEPVELYHPVFNEFQDAIKNTEPFHADAETYIAVRNFLSACYRKLRDEGKRIEAIKESMRPLLGQELFTVVDNKVESDGVIKQSCGRSTAYLLILEVNVDTDTSDPYNRGSLAYRKYWISRKLN